MFPPRADNVVAFSRIEPRRRQDTDDDPPPRRYSKRRHKRPLFTKSGANIRTLCFRSYHLIVEAEEAELLRDVCLDTHKAEVKLRKVKERLQGERERSAALIELLTTAETKLSAAIVAALLSNRSRES
jgi:hypothetical protein